MARIRNIYQSELLYIGPVGPRPCNSEHSSFSVSDNINSAVSGENFVSQLFRVQNIAWNYSKNLTDINQLGELAAIDRIPLSAPLVELNYSYLLSNFINEGLIGLTVNQAGDTQQISSISGILNNETDSKNYFIKTAVEGSDVVNNNSNNYNVISFGNCYLNSYSSRGAVNAFPTVDISIVALNIQAQNVVHTEGAVIPAIDPIDGTPINFGYILDSGTQNYNGYSSNSNDSSLSVLRPGDIQMSFGLGEGDGFYQESDLKVQNYTISFNLNRNDIAQLGAKYYIKKVPTFPVTVTMAISAICGEMQTGNLIDIVKNNKIFNPSVTIRSSKTNNVVCYYQLKGANLDNQDVSMAISENKLLNFNFSSQIGGNSSSSLNGLFISGLGYFNSLITSGEDWGLVIDAVTSSEDWDSVAAAVDSSEEWGSII